MPASDSDSEDSADERQDGPVKSGWIWAIGSMVGNAAEYAADFFVSGSSSSAAASSSLRGDVGSSSSASSAGGVGTSPLGAGVSTKKRTRCDRDKGEMLRLYIGASEKLSGGSDVYMKPCVVGRSYVGDKVLAALSLHDNVTKESMVNQLTANLSSCQPLLQILSPYAKSELQKFLDNAVIKLKYIADKLVAHATLNSLQPTALFFCLTSRSLNASVIFEDESSCDGMFHRLMVSSLGESAARNHLYVSVTSSLLGDNIGYRAIKNARRQQDSRLQANEAKDLITALHRLCEGNGGLSHAALFRDPDSNAQWSRHFGARPKSSETGPFLRFFGSSVRSGSFPASSSSSFSAGVTVSEPFHFTAKELESAYNASAQANITGSTKYSRLLASLVQTSFSNAHPSTSEISLYLSAFGSSALSKLRSYCRHAQRHAARFASGGRQSSLSYDDDTTIHFKTVAAELFSELFTLQGSDAMTSAEYGDYNDGDGSDDGELDGESPASRIRVSNPQQRTGRITFDVSSLQLPLVLPQQHSDSVSFFAFAQYAIQSAVCVETLSTSDGCKSVVFMPPYNDNRATHGKPCKLTVLRVANEVKVVCSCPYSRRGSIHTCWHERTVKLPGVLDALATAALVTCDPLLGHRSAMLLPFSL